MPIMLPISIFCMISALACYSVGVWSEKFSGRLKTWHTAFFWIGFIFDTTGTTLMGEMAGKMEFDFHGITGALAIFFMLSHAIWATVVLLQKREQAIQNFHKISIFVWGLWLVPFVTGMVGAMVH
jgi:uncharacterized repeat protein (TIGR03987 family)